MTQIIYLNGPTSVGKTTIAKAIQAEAKQMWLHIGIDRMIDLMPEKFNDWSGQAKTEGFSFVQEGDMQIVQAGPIAQKLIQAYYSVIEALAKEGHHFIIDDVALNIEEFNAIKKRLQSFSVLYIGLTAPLEVLKKREKARGNRMIGSALHQYEVTHKGVEYDMMIDTNSESREQTVKKILLRV